MLRRRAPAPAPAPAVPAAAAVEGVRREANRCGRPRGVEGDLAIENMWTSGFTWVTYGPSPIRNEAVSSCFPLRLKNHYFVFLYKATMNPFGTSTNYLINYCESIKSYYNFIVI